MLTKILFTLVVIVGVALFYRTKSAESAAAPKRPQPAATESAPSTRTIAYALIGILIAISVAVFAYNRQQNYRIVNIRVTADGGNVVNYQARHKDIKGRSFISLQGVQVKLGEGDRVEMLNQ